MATKKAVRRDGSLRNYYESSSKQRAKKTAKYEPQTVFLIMAFEGTDSAYATIKEECHKRKLNAMRADEDAGSDLVILKILRHIEAAQFIICDLTNGRPNVYYELGYAHGTGNWPDTILLVAEKGTTLHFDLAAFQVKEYGSTEELRSIVSKALIEWEQMPKSQKLSPRRASKKR
jgi:uncharacterized protein YeaC (DUF1315 family)